MVTVPAKVASSLMLHDEDALASELFFTGD